MSPTHNTGAFSKCVYLTLCTVQMHFQYLAFHLLQHGDKHSSQFLLLPHKHISMTYLEEMPVNFSFGYLCLLQSQSYLDSGWRINLFTQVFTFIIDLLESSLGCEFEPHCVKEGSSCRMTDKRSGVRFGQLRKRAL